MRIKHACTNLQSTRYLRWPDDAAQVTHVRKPSCMKWSSTPIVTCVSSKVSWLCRPAITVTVDRFFLRPNALVFIGDKAISRQFEVWVCLAPCFIRENKNIISLSDIRLNNIPLHFDNTIYPSRVRYVADVIHRRPVSQWYFCYQPVHGRLMLQYFFWP